MRRRQHQLTQAEHNESVVEVPEEPVDNFADFLERGGEEANKV